MKIFTLPKHDEFSSLWSSAVLLSSLIIAKLLRTFKNIGLFGFALVDAEVDVIEGGIKALIDVDGDCCCCCSQCEKQNWWFWCLQDWKSDDVVGNVGEFNNKGSDFCVGDVAIDSSFGKSEQNVLVLLSNEFLNKKIKLKKRNKMKLNFNYFEQIYKI